MEVVYEWARGMPFKAVMDLTDVSEGELHNSVINQRGRHCENSMTRVTLYQSDEHI